MYVGTSSFVRTKFPTVMILAECDKGLAATCIPCALEHSKEKYQNPPPKKRGKKGKKKEEGGYLTSA